MNPKRRWQSCRSSFNLAAALAAVLSLAGEGNWLYASPINPAVFQTKFESAKKDAEVVADVRVVTVVCTEAKKKDDTVRSVTLQVAMQVLAVEKGPVKKNEIVVVSREVQLPVGPGPGMYGYMAETHQFPFTPGVKGSVSASLGQGRPGVCGCRRLGAGSQQRQPGHSQRSGKGNVGNRVAGEMRRTCGCA